LLSIDVGRPADPESNSARAALLISFLAYLRAARGNFADYAEIAETFRLSIFNKINLRQTLRDSSKRLYARARAFIKFMKNITGLYYYHHYYYYYIGNNGAGRMFNFVNEYPVNRKNMASSAETKYSLFFALLETQIAHKIIYFPKGEGGRSFSASRSHCPSSPPPLLIFQRLGIIRLGERTLRYRASA